MFLSFRSTNSVTSFLQRLHRVWRKGDLNPENNDEAQAEAHSRKIISASCRFCSLFLKALEYFVRYFMGYLNEFLTQIELNP